MRIAIFGTGGVGGYFGGRLAQAGEDVIFIARGDHLQAIRQGGLHVESTEGDFTIQPAQATDNPAAVGPVDAVLVGVKAWQVPEAANSIQPLVGPDTFVVPLQNGVEAPRQLASVLGEAHVLGGMCKIMSYITAPGQVRHAGIAPVVVFGELDNHASERTARLQKAFERTQGVQVDVPADIQAAMWTKFLLVTAWSGLGAVTRAPIGILRSLPETRRMLVEAMREIAAVAEAHAITLPEAIVDDTMAFFDGLPEGGTTSLQRDIMEGRPSELEAQPGAVVRLGHAVDLPTPLHSFIYHSLLPQERRARGDD